MDWKVFTLTMVPVAGVIGLYGINRLTAWRLKKLEKIATDHSVYEPKRMTVEYQATMKPRSSAAMPPTFAGKPRRERSSPPVRSSRVEDKDEDIFNPTHPLSPLNPINMVATTVYISDAHAAHHVPPPSDPSPPSAPDNLSADTSSSSSYDSGSSSDSSSSGGSDGW